MSGSGRNDTIPKLSIIIPSYNKVDFIDATLNSIIRQKYRNYEVIIQDGGSTDGTLEIIKKYAKKYAKTIRFESKKDKGQADAINKGLKKADGDILTFINADDVYEDGAFGSVVKSYQSNPDALWFAGKGRVIDSKGKVIAKYVTAYKDFFLFQNNYNLLLITNYLMQPSVFLTQKAIQELTGFDITAGIVMEYAAWLELGKIKMPVIINKTLSSFRMSGSNISASSYTKTLGKDEEIIRRHTHNPIILYLHKLNNIGRQFVVKSL